MKTFLLFFLFIVCMDVRCVFGEQQFQTDLQNYLTATIHNISVFKEELKSLEQLEKKHIMLKKKIVLNKNNLTRDYEENLSKLRDKTLDPANQKEIKNLNKEIQKKLTVTNQLLDGLGEQFFRITTEKKQRQQDIKTSQALIEEIQGYLSSFASVAPQSPSDTGVNKKK